MAGINRTTGKATDLITFSRASGGTALRKISYGSELVTNGSFDTGDLTGWIKVGEDATHTVTYSNGGARYQSDTTSPALYFRQNGILETGKLYRFEIETTTLTSGSLKIDNLEGGTINVTPAVGTTVFFGIPTSNDLVMYRNTSNVDVTIDNISVKEVLFDQPDGTLTLFNHPTNIPRIEYDAAGNVKGLLIEEARTNLVTYSEDFTAVNWTKVRSSVSNGFGETSPLGNEAYKLLGTTDNNTHFIYVNVTATGDRVVSVFAKAAELSWLILANTGFGALSASYNLSTGAVGTVAGFSSANAEAVGDGWYRCSAVVPSATADGSFDFVVALGSDDNTYVFVGATNEGIYIDGAQLEEGSFPTSYIPTSGGAATRAADIASISVDSFGYNQKAGTVVVDVNTFDTDYNNWVWVLDGTSDTSLYGHSAANGWRVFGAGGTVSYLGSLPTNADAQIGYAYSNVGSATLLDGGSVFPAAHSQPVAVTTVRLGAASTSAAFLNGHIKSIAYYPRRLSNAQLQELTA